MPKPRSDAPGDGWLEHSRKTVAGARLGPQVETVGRVERVADGIAFVSGLPDVRLDELLRFEGDRYGFALTLDADLIGVVILDEAARIEAGMRVTGTGEVVRVPVGPGLLGRVIDPLGRRARPDGSHQLRNPGRRTAPGPTNRSPPPSHEGRADQSSHHDLRILHGERAEVIDIQAAVRAE